MTTPQPGAPGEVGQDAPRHARARRTSRAAALEQEAARTQKAAKAASTTKRAAGAAKAAGGPEGAALGKATEVSQKVGTAGARFAKTARVPTGNRRYQGVILAEFVTAALIVALAPIARGKAAQDKTPGPSPYGVDDIKQLAGIGAVYFVLALLSSGKWGRISAWFGGLVLVAIGLSETTSGGLPAIFGIFQPASKSSGAGEITPAQEGQILNQAGQAAQAGANVYPTQQQLFQGAGQAAQSGATFYTFTQPGVATTDELTPGVTVQQI